MSSPLPPPRSSVTPTPSPPLPHPSPSPSPSPATSTPLTSDAERVAFTAVFDPSLTRGKVFCLVVVSWWEEWCEYTGFDRDTVPPPFAPFHPSHPHSSSPSPSSPPQPPLEDPDAIVKKSTHRPGPINNSPLLRLLHPHLPLHALHPHLQEHTDFVFLNHAAFSLLLSWYGGGPSIERQVVSRGFVEELIIELHPITLLFCYVDEQGRIIRSIAAPPAGGGGGGREEGIDGAVEDERGRRVLAKRRMATFSKDTTLRALINQLRPPFAVDSAGNPLEGRVWLRQAVAVAAPRGEERDGGSAPVRTEEDEDEEFELVHEKEYSSTLEFLDWTSGMDIAVEYRHPQHPERWCRSSGKKKGDTWRDFEVGDEVDALDTQNKWYESVIRKVGDGQVFVHFKGWQDKWDEKRPFNDKRLAPRSLYTTGARDAAASRQQSRDGLKYNTQGKPMEKGVVGLRNLGNTCFMNSIIQSLIQTPVLTKYFIEKRYRKEINRNNPLGWQGKVAEEYGELVEEMWGGQFNVVAPKLFKQVLGEFQPRFSGYQQHDSSEFLSFLLDGLHEDLNRVHKKPLTAAVESGGRPDLVVAKEAWERHLQRNQSIIIDLCGGQFKSKVVCPECSLESITFDPFLFLSLPIPQQTHIYRELTFVPSKHTAALLHRPHNTPFLVTVQLPKHATVSDIKAGLSTALRLPLHHGKLLLAELHEGKILKALQETSLIDKVREKDCLCMYEVDELVFNKGVTEKWTTLQVVQYVRTDPPGGKLRQAGVPTVVAVPSHLLSAMPLRLIHQRVADSASALWQHEGDGDDMSVDSHTSNGARMDDGELPSPSPSPPFTSNGHSRADHPQSLPFELVLMDRHHKVNYCDIPRSKSDSDPTEIDLLAKAPSGAGFSFAVIHPASHASRLLMSAASLEPINPSDTALLSSSSSSRKHLTIFDCLNSFCTAETLRKSEAWYCSACKQHQQASKKIDLWTAPSVLILHLKRFSFTSTYRDKLDMKVDFPIEGLDLSSFVRGGSASGAGLIYDLYAVSNHFGGLGGGHYTAYAKNLKNGLWYSLDDSNVSQVHPGSVVTEAAYVLFYASRGLGKTTAATPGTANGRARKANP